MFLSVNEKILADRSQRRRVSFAFDLLSLPKPPFTVSLNWTQPIKKVQSMELTVYVPLTADESLEILKIVLPTKNCQHESVVRAIVPPFYCSNLFAFKNDLGVAYTWRNSTDREKKSKIAIFQNLCKSPVFLWDLSIPKWRVWLQDLLGMVSIIIAVVIIAVIKQYLRKLCFQSSL